MHDTPEPQVSEQQEPDVRPSMSSLVGELLSGRYRIEAELGSGGMGAVYRAEHTLMRKRVAIKVLHPEMTQHTEVVERFEREAMAAAHIEHPNVAAATDFGKLENGSFFLVLEYVEGASLRDVLQQGPMHPRRVIHIGKQIATALARAHGLGIVHRDLKPENIMLVSRDTDPDFVKVLDFGIAKVPVSQISKEAGKQHKTLTKVGMVYGTPEYMAPEQALGQDVDARADLYALGVILYEMLVGRRPFEADNPVALLGMQVTQPPPAFRQVAPGLHLPQEIEAIVMELLEKEAARRPSDAKQVRDVFEILEQNLDTSSWTEDARSNVSAAMSLTHAPTVFEGIASAKPRAPSIASVMARISAWSSQLAQTLRAADAQAQPHRWQAALPAPLRTLKLSVWLGLAAGVGMLALIVVIGIVWWVRTPSTVKPVFDETSWASPPVASSMQNASATADPQQLEKAVKAGSESIEQLLTQFPNDPAVLAQVAKARLGGASPDTCIEVYDKLFSLDPEKRKDNAVLEDVLGALTKPSSQEVVFSLLESHWGTEGPDLIHDLAFGKRTTTAAIASRAAKSIKSEAARKNASPALLIALDLRFNGGCQAKHRLLDRAREHGDERSLTQLRG
ncbi:MAG TPA: serine/threonine-protein kinase, partial [Polyangiaceae bacterium]|nr:serine/threonine-protein kinase [Polyangiaceae bacterium]